MTTRKLYMFVLVLIVCQSIAHAGLDSLFIKGNNKYQKGKYEAAVSAYKQILDSGYTSAEVYYNLGNAYYKNHRYDQAILYYERAKLLAPNDEDIKHNIELARKQTTDKIEKVPEFFLSKWMNYLTHTLSVNQWALISAIGFILFLGFLTIYFGSGRILLKKYAFWLSLVLLIISISGYIFSRNHYQKIQDSDHAIITTGAVNVVSEPIPNSKKLFVIHRGTKVKIENCRNEWCKIKLPNGNAGWIKPKNMTEI